MRWWRVKLRFADQRGRLLARLSMEVGDKKLMITVAIDATLFGLIDDQGARDETARAIRTARRALREAMYGA